MTIDLPSFFLLRYIRIEYFTNLLRNIKTELGLKILKSWDVHSIKKASTNRILMFLKVVLKELYYFLRIPRKDVVYFIYLQLLDS